MVYYHENETLGQVYYYVDYHTDSTSYVYVFMYMENISEKGFVSIGLSGAFKMQEAMFLFDNIEVLSAKVKLNSGKTLPFPLDQRPQIKLSKDFKVIDVAGMEAKFLKEVSKDKLRHMRAQFENWDGGKIKW